MDLPTKPLNATPVRQHAEGLLELDLRERGRSDEGTDVGDQMD